MTLDKQSVQNLVTSAAAGTGTKVSAVSLVQPDRMTVTTPAGKVSGQLQVSQQGELQLVPTTGPTLSLVGTGPGQPVKLESVQITPDGLELGGSVNLTTP
jgi:hypothetical protein